MAFAAGVAVGLTTVEAQGTTDDNGDPPPAPPESRPPEADAQAAAPDAGAADGDRAGPAAGPQEVLPGPTLADWTPEPLWPAETDPARQQALEKEYPLWGVATWHRSEIFRVEQGKPVVVGHVYYGWRVRASPPVEASGCSKGAWHEIPGNGLICNAWGFEVGEHPPTPPHKHRSPDISQPYPFQYVKIRKTSPRFTRLPTAEDEAALAEAKSAEAAVELEAVDLYIDGILWVAVDRIEKVGERAYYHTTDDRWVRVADVEPKTMSQMHGVLLDGGRKLPYAFVYGEETHPLYRFRDGAPVRVGTAHKHARFPVAGVRRHDGTGYVLDPEGRALLRSAVRVAARAERPSEVPAGSKWIHLNLAEQTLVAYEDERPRLVTLLSSGAEGYDTPTGLYRIQRRYVTKTMEGPDADHGWYIIAEIPWTFYYHGNYAIHGAYWHNVFGNVRSHGCTNVPVADARWLVRWLDPPLPRRWHTMFWQERSWAHFVDETVDLAALLARSGVGARPDRPVDDPDPGGDQPGGE